MTTAGRQRIDDVGLQVRTGGGTPPAEPAGQFPKDSLGGRASGAVPALAVSVVVYRPDMEILRQSLGSLREAADKALACGLDSVSLAVVDNGGDAEAFARVGALVREVWGDREGLFAREVLNERNVGFGLGHNQAAREAVGGFRLILNPDVLLEPDTLVEALKFMQDCPEAGLVSPRAVDADGNRQYLCKQYPAILDLTVRGFMPRVVQKLFRRRLDRYEMRGITEDQVVPSVPIASGCFMLVRESIWHRVGGFDPRFFLYFEDFDLSLRIGAIARVAYVPSVRIEHFGGHAARKGIRHIYLFMRSALTFYRIHGWRWK